MELSSPSFSSGGEIPKRYTWDGENLSPPLSIHGPPAGTQSLALIVEDLDSPLGVLTHWVIWNLPADTAEVSEGRAPAGAEVGLNGFGEATYHGPAPPSGRHRYRFRLLALDTTLEATTSDRKQHVLSEASGHVLAEADLIACFAGPG